MAKNNFVIVDCKDLYSPVLYKKKFPSIDKACEYIEGRWGIDYKRFSVITYREALFIGMKWVEDGKRLYKKKYEYPAECLTRTQRSSFRRRNRYYRDKYQGSIGIVVGTKSYLFKDLVRSHFDSKRLCFKIPKEFPNQYFLNLTDRCKISKSREVVGMVKSICVDFNTMSVRKKLVYIKFDYEVVPITTGVFYNKIQKIKKKVKDKKTLIQLGVWQQE